MWHEWRAMLQEQTYPNIYVENVPFLCDVFAALGQFSGQIALTNRLFLIYNKCNTPRHLRAFCIACCLRLTFFYFETMTQFKLFEDKRKYLYNRPSAFIC